MNFPILSSLILLPTIGALFIFFVRSSSEKYQASKYLSLFISIANFFLSIYLWYIFDKYSVDFQGNGSSITRGNLPELPGKNIGLNPFVIPGSYLEF